ncbi:MAG: ATP-dependent helicase, partial [Chloroflexota bacterium]
QAMVLLRDNIFELGLKRYLPLGDPTRFVGAMVDLFTRAKEEGIRPDDLHAFARELEAGARAASEGVEDEDAREVAQGLLDEAAGHAELAGAYSAYQRLLCDRALIDHGDQVCEAVRLLDERPAVRMSLRRRFDYIVVDEAQDANPQQLQLVRQLAGHAGNVMFVGDDDQAIYSFRGAVGEGLAELDAQYLEMRDVVLRRNYRSRAPILEAARRLIRHNDPDRLEVSRGIDKKLTAVRRSRRPAMVRHRSSSTATEEADQVAADIKARLERGASPASVAVLVRTNADASPVLASLDVLGVPRRFSGASGLLAHREVRDVLSLMSVIAAPNTSEDLYAVMSSQPYGLGGAELTSICELASRRRRPLWSVIGELVEQPGILRLTPDTRARLERVVRDIRASLEIAHERAAPAVLYEHLRGSGWLAKLVAAAERGDEGPLRRVARLFEIVKDQSDLVTDSRLAVVVPALRALLDAGQDPAAPGLNEGTESVAVLTIHQAKGLEFSTVFVIGVSEGRFPLRARRDPLSLPRALTGHAEKGDQVAHRAEERRLFYVAMTRARDELILSHAAAGARGGRHRRPSAFLAEALGHEVDDGTAGDASPVEAAIGATPAAGAGPMTRNDSARASGPMELSFTQIDDYLSCPLKYRLRHQVRVPTPPNHALTFGSAMHQAVASFNAARLRGMPMDHSSIVATLDAHWSSEGFISQEHEEARHAAGADALARFIARSRGASNERIIAVERPFSVRIGGDRVRGRYDAIRETAEGTVITDYKTGDVREPSRARQRARSSLQLQLYSLAYEAESNAPPAAVELHFLEGDVIGRVAPTERQLDGSRSKVTKAAQGIRDGRFEATPGFPACDWCPYRRICPASG